MTGLLQGLQRLTAPERRQLTWMLLALPLIHASIGLAGYGRTRRWLDSLSHSANPRPATQANIDSARSAARIASIAGRRGTVNATCLRQALLVYWLLRKRGLAPELKLGVRKHEGVVDAHAWVELEGQSLDPQPLVHKAFEPYNRTEDNSP